MTWSAFGFSNKNRFQIFLSLFFQKDFLKEYFSYFKYFWHQWHRWQRWQRWHQWHRFNRLRQTHPTNRRRQKTRLWKFWVWPCSVVFAKKARSRWKWRHWLRHHLLWRQSRVGARPCGSGRLWLAAKLLCHLLKKAKAEDVKNIGWIFRRKTLQPTVYCVRL